MKKAALVRIQTGVWGAFAAAVLLLSACEALFEYGKLGGADITGTVLPESDAFEARMESLSGIWYSHYAGIGRLDGYRIGKWSNFSVWGKDRADALFPGWEKTTYAEGTEPEADDYVVIYDDTVYGQADDNTDRQESWGFSYMGVVRTLNFFDKNPKRGAIIIEYFKGADPGWLWGAPGNWTGGSQGLKQGEKPFFGIYYRELSRDIVQMANAVDLAALYAGKHYYTETATLEEAIANNTIENEAEYISWGVVIPQDREK